MIGTGEVNWADAFNWQGGILPTLFSTSTVYLNSSGAVITMPAVNPSLGALVTGDVTLLIPPASSTVTLSVSSLTCTGTTTISGTSAATNLNAFVSVSGGISIAAGATLNSIKHRLTNAAGSSLIVNLATGAKYGNNVNYPLTSNQPSQQYPICNTKDVN
jgi:hypothetical protein